MTPSTPRAFLWSRGGPRRSPHSSPTRRSSDLAGLGGGARLLDRARGERVGVDLAERRAPRDRKSTRLNSSHANISYAVFCLKKKTHAPRQGLPDPSGRRAVVR